MEEVSVSVSLSFVVTGQAEHGRGQAQGVVAAVDEIDLKPNKRRDLALGTASSATCDPHPPYTHSMPLAAPIRRFGRESEGEERVGEGETITCESHLF